MGEQHTILYTFMNVFVVQPLENSISQEDMGYSTLNVCTIHIDRMKATRLNDR